MTSLDDILAAVGALAETVKAQGEQIAALAGATVPADAAEDLSHIVFEQGNGAYAPLVELGAGNQSRRLLLAQMWELGSSEAGAVLDSGARGLYRKLERPENLDGPLLARHIALAMVGDALTEDALEAADMGADLLKDWGGVEAPELGKPHLIAGSAVT